jgi:outer membrane protein assembly factor BamB
VASFNDNKTYCLDATSGSVRWSTFILGGTVSSPAVDSTGVYILADSVLPNATLYKLNPDTGAIIWAQNKLPHGGTFDLTDYSFSSVTIGRSMIGDTGMVFVGQGRSEAGGAVSESVTAAYHGINATTGAIKWVLCLLGGERGW